MFGRVSLQVGDPEDVVVAPLSAISFSPYGNSVFVLGGPMGTAQGQPALRADRRRRGDLIVIMEGLDPVTAWPPAGCSSCATTRR
jgi:membrane fusion protein, multidrug efflux system